MGIDQIQLAITPGWETTNAIFVLRQLQEKHLAQKKKLYFRFLDLEKAFDWVPVVLVVGMVGFEETWGKRVVG